MQLKEMDIRNSTHTMEIVDRLEELCTSHDWYFQMADDYRAYEAGLVVADEINYLKGVLIARGYKTQAESLIARYRPKMPTLETLLKPKPTKMPPVVNGRYDFSLTWNSETEEWE